jgi:hypothetical protein
MVPEPLAVSPNLNNPKFAEEALPMVVHLACRVARCGNTTIYYTAASLATVAEVGTG